LYISVGFEDGFTFNYIIRLQLLHIDMAILIEYQIIKLNISKIIKS